MTCIRLSRRRWTPQGRILRRRTGRSLACRYPGAGGCTSEQNGQFRGPTPDADVPDARRTAVHALVEAAVRTGCGASCRLAAVAARRWRRLQPRTVTWRHRDKAADDIGRVPVEQAAAGPVIAESWCAGPRRRRLLHIPATALRHPGGRDEGVLCVGRSGLADSRAAGGLADDPPGALVAVQPPPVRGQEHRPAGPFPDGQVDRAGGPRRQRDGDDLAALACDRQRPVPALEPQVLDVRAGGLGDPQAVEREQGDQRMLAGGPSPAATSMAPSSLRSSAVAWDS